jgi:hypothetical protein
MKQVRGSCRKSATDLGETFCCKDEDDSCWYMGLIRVNKYGDISITVRLYDTVLASFSAKHTHSDTKH